jgi:hypothetical protein
MTLRGRVENGVVILTGGAPLPERTLVDVVPVADVAGPASVGPGQEYPVSKEQKEALLGLIGMWKVEHPPSDEEVDRVVEEYRMKKYG